MHPETHWIAIAILPDGTHMSGAFECQSKMQAFIRTVLDRHRDAMVYYAVPCLVTNRNRAF